MHIQHQDDLSKGFFYIENDGRLLAKMTYVWQGANSIVIEHTVVSDELKGKGAGKALVEEAVNFARQKHIRIIPVCPFAKSVFEKTPGYSDVINHS